jgi:hypothetical protein
VSVEAAPAETEAAAAPGTAAVAPGRRQKQKRVKPGEEPIQADVDPKILDSIFNFFGLEASFPMRQQLVTRSGATEDKTARKIYFVTSGAFPLSQNPTISASAVTNDEAFLKTSVCNRIWLRRTARKFYFVAAGAFPLSQNPTFTVDAVKSIDEAFPPSVCNQI